MKQRCGQVSELDLDFNWCQWCGEKLAGQFSLLTSVQHKLFDTFYFQMSMHKELDVCRLGFSSLVH